MKLIEESKCKRWMILQLSNGSYVVDRKHEKGFMQRKFSGDIIELSRWIFKNESLFKQDEIAIDIWKTVKLIKR